MEIRFTLKSIGFIVILMVPVFWVASFDKHVLEPENINLSRIIDARNHLELDYLVVGNSYGYSSLYPPLFDSLEIDIYNYGTPGAGVLMYELMINDFLNCLGGKTSNVILTISPTIFSVGGDDWGANPYHRYLNCPQSSAKMLIEDLNLEKLLKATQSGFVRGLFYLRSNERSNHSEILNASEDYKGFYHRYDTFSTKYYQENKHLYQKYLDDNFKDRSRERLINILSSLKKRGINPIVIETPTNKLTDFFNEEFLSEYSNTLDEIERKGYKLVRNKLYLDSTYYRDIDHVNYFGASVFTANLINMLGLENLD
ncbi:hypothetical protein [Ekhidna sp.]|uniref:hypothetical protein n=1 Tax=Ekhidna sp. TaxID=2608089 RepID=UPI003298D516